MCHTEVALRNDGRLWTHGGGSEFKNGFWYRVHCKGAGRRTDGAFPVLFVLEWAEYLARRKSRKSIFTTTV